MDPDDTTSPFDEGLLEIEIDASLIEEALAAVERAGTVPNPPPAPVFVDPAVGAEELDEERARRLLAEARIAQLEGELVELRAEQGRALAAQESQVREGRQAVQEFERFRQRARKDLEEAERRGEERALRALLDVSDNLERANLQADADHARVVQGLSIVVEQVRRQLLRVGFERLPAGRGHGFDPEIHEAVVHVEDDDIPEGTIVEEVSPGYRLRGRLFRPARVTVATRFRAGEA